MLSSRPSATGNTMPGNSTRLRVATIGTASAGKGGSSIRVWAGLVSISSIVFLACSIGSGPGQAHFQQPIHVARFGDLHSSWQDDPSHKMAMRNLQAADDSVAIANRQRPPRTHGQSVRLDRDFDLFRGDAGQRELQ